jgi:integrase
MSRAQVVVETRHKSGCAKTRKTSKRCSCTPTFRARVWDPQRSRAMPGPSFPLWEQAERWGLDRLFAQRRGVRSSGGDMTVAEAGEWLFAEMDGGRVLSRNKSQGQRQFYKPSTVRSYKQVWRDHVVPRIGAEKVGDLRRPLVQQLIWDLTTEPGLGASTVRNAVIPLRVLYRELIKRERVHHNPTHDLDLPPGIGKRTRIVERDDIAAMLSALAATDSPVWATAVYAGLRHGELKAAAADWVDLDAKLLHVSGSWDQYEGRVGPKSDAGDRTIPIVAPLVPYLRSALARRPTGLLFGREDDLPFQSNRLQGRADTAWKNAGMPRWTLHELRHSFVSHAYMAGVDLKTIQEWAGHASASFTGSYYTHLSRGHHQKAGAALSTYFASDETREADRSAA